MGSSSAAYLPRSIGALRLQSDKRQIGAMLMLFGMCAIFQPLANIAAAIGPDGTTVQPALEIPFSGFIGALCLCKIGILAVFIGYAQAAHDWGSPLLTAYLLIFAQTAFIPYVTNMTNIGKTARTGVAPWIPAFYNGDAADTKFVGAMGILGVLTYGFAFIGSLSFMVFSLFAFQKGKPQARDATYYRGRLGFYSPVLLLAGLTQLMLGSYIIHKWEALKLEFPINIAMFTVVYPIMTVVVGAIQVINGLWGWHRSLWTESHGGIFAFSCVFGWLMQFSLQIVTQAGILPGNTKQQWLAFATAMTFGLNLMPAYLDSKTRWTPEIIEDEHYTVGTADGAEQPRGEFNA